jgi:hypothetical protein
MTKSTIPPTKVTLLAIATFAIAFAVARILPSTPSHPAPSDSTYKSPIPIHRTLSSTPHLSQSKTAKPKLAFLRSLSRATPGDYPRLLARPTSQREAALIINTWAKTDPQACFDHLLKTVAHQYPSGFRPFPALFRQWALTDPDTALAAALDPRLDHSKQENSLGQLFSSLINKDPAHALALLEKTLTDYPHLEFRPDFKSRDWTSGDPGAMAKSLATLPDSEFRSIGLRQCMQRWFDQDPNAAAIWLATTDAQDDWWVASSLVNKWVNADPESAAQYVTKNIVGEYRNSLTSQVAEKWAILDPEAALDWALADTWGAPRQNALTTIFHTLGRENTAAALELIDRIPDQDQKHRAINSLVSAWSRRAPGQAIEWTNQHVDKFDSRHEAALSNIAESWSGANATWASRQTAEMLAENPDALPLSFTQTIAWNYAIKHPDRAVDWALDLPPNHAKFALRDSLEYWIIDHPQLAQRDSPEYWMTGHPQPAARHVLNQVPPGDPRRPQALDTITTLYLDEHGPDVARAFIDTLPSQQERARLYHVLDNPPR